MAIMLEKFCTSIGSSKNRLEVMTPEFTLPCNRPHESDPPSGSADDGGGRPRDS